MAPWEVAHVAHTKIRPAYPGPSAHYYCRDNEASSPSKWTETVVGLGPSQYPQMMLVSPVEQWTAGWGRRPPPRWPLQWWWGPRQWRAAQNSYGRCPPPCSSSRCVCTAAGHAGKGEWEECESEREEVTILDGLYQRYITDSTNENRRANGHLVSPNDLMQQS